MNKKGFTLIELLAVIIILAVIALIATPIVLNVIENARREANKNSVYGLLDGAKLYYAESLLDENKQSNINGTTNLINEIKISGDKPDSGVIYINSKGETALAVVYDNVCYSKNFSQVELQESDDITNCTLGVDETPVTPSKPSVPEVSYKCIRATELHTEECTQTSSSYYCSSAGYTTSGSKGTTTITYGSLGTKGTLTSGDAFDCDVDGTGYNHRFYYVSDLYDTTTKTFNSDYAVLIYYNNTTKGVADNTTSSLISYNDTLNFYGPIVAAPNLPTTTQWNNVSLLNTERVILTEDGTPTKYADTEAPTFSYSGYAARLLTYQEVAVACGGDDNPTSIGEIDPCNYFVENTNFSNGKLTEGYWTETNVSKQHSRVWFVSGQLRDVYNNEEHSNKNYFGTRPAIEVLKTHIEI